MFNIAFVLRGGAGAAQIFDWSLERGLARSRRQAHGRPSARITLPLDPAVGHRGGALAFTLSFDEFIIAYFTAGAGQASTTLPMQIYAMIRFGVTPEINAMATIIIIVSFVLVLSAQRLNRGRLPGP